MRRALPLAAMVAAAFILGTAPSVSAHAAPPCNDSGGPGHSDYATHHIVPLAQAGALGEGGHRPGTAHQGYSSCVDTGN
jgi:hypothetical protein